ncbi:HEPN domain-containing protein [Haloplanus rubicundus]|uniref:hypothetical protein n=1 Tax=Haloplanus rubicundus TaxID=1547898 RepID=UPI0013009809|nr:hypothetical protein [Haloplanus rubicundus]
MNADTDNISYARTQLSEARRRLASVRERISDIERQEVVGAVDQRDNELAVGENIKIAEGEDIEKIPEKHRQYVTLSRRDKEVVNIEPHIQNIIIDCQMSIELSVKSMFKAVDQEFDYSHGIGFESHNTQDFNRKVPADFPRREDIVRAIFLTQLWERFYELAKYGAPELNVGPSVIFEIDDGERALNDAAFCVELAEEFIDYVDESE